jgi:hypothetical protein
MGRPGLHWPNTGVVDAAARSRFLRGRFNGCVMLDVTPTIEATWVRQNCRWLVTRLYEQPGTLLHPDTFVSRHADWIRAVDPRGWYQVLNEPDREYPRYSAKAFADWWLHVLAVLHVSFPGIRVGFPAPSIGCDSHYVEQLVDSGVLAFADFIGERGYWQSRAMMFDRSFGWRWLRFATRVRVPVFLTEFGCSDATTPKGEKALQYLDYCASLPRFVLPLGAFIGAGGDAFWDSEAAGRLWIDDAMCAILGRDEFRVLGDESGTRPWGTNGDSSPVTYHASLREEVGLSQEQVRKYAALIVSTALANRLAPSLVAGLIDVESGGIEHATSPDNGPGLGHALGLMQVLEGNFAAGQDGRDPATNLAVGCRMLRAKIDSYGGRIESGLAAYFGAVDAQGNPTDGTDVTGTTGKQYVADVLGAQRQYLDLDPVAGSGAPADPDFQQYAPRTGTWREAAVNLKGIADKALSTGREIVADLTACADRAVKEWGGQ